VVIDSSYNGGFMAGRIVSILMAKLVRPRNLISVSCGACVLAAAALCLVGGVSKIGLYAGTGKREREPLREEEIARQATGVVVNICLHLLA